MTANYDPRERAERGAAYLDAISPGWAKRIDVTGLSMGNARRCVIGQLFGNYCDYIEAEPEWREGAWAARLGFDLPPDHGAYADLKACWLQLIEERRCQQHLVAAGATP